MNGQSLKHYISGDSYNEDVDIIQVTAPETFIKENFSESVEAEFEKVQFR